MKIKILADGYTKWQRFIRHWGLSILIDDSILFDTFGQPGYVLKQMRRSRIDPFKIRDIVISHDDWDHIAGLPGILEIGADCAVYICPNFRPEIKATIRSYGQRVIEADKPLEIRRNIYVSGELKGGSRSGIALPEQYMAIKGADGITIITGCAHPGIVEIVRHARVSFDVKIDLVIGGFHLKDNTDQANREIVKKLKALEVRRVMPLHCTGRRAQDIFRELYGDDYISTGVGRPIEI